MSVLRPSEHARSSWFEFLDRFVCDLHRSGFLASLIVHIVVLLALATYCLDTDLAVPRVACVVSFEGSGDESLDEGDSDIAAAAADARITAVADSPVEQFIEPVPLVADTFFDVPREEPEGLVVESAGVLFEKIGSGLGAEKGAGSGTATFFGVKATGDTFVYIVDFSRSMIGPRLTQAKYELHRSITLLPADASFFIILFTEKAMPMPARELVPATTANKKRFLNWVARHPVGGGTHPVDAIVTAVRLKPDVIFLLTDGEFADPQAALDVVTRSQGPRFHTVAFHDNRGEQVLREIARVGRGEYRFKAP